MFRIVTLLIMSALCLLALAGCGNGDSNTTGSLGLTVTATDLTGGVFTVDSSAVYLNSAATSLQGIPVKISISIHTLTGIPQTVETELKTDSTGTVNNSQKIQQIGEPIFVDVSATSGGLSQTKTVTVPKL